MTTGARAAIAPPSAQPERRERSLFALLGLADAWKFGLETLLLLGAIQLVQARYGGALVHSAAMPHPFWIPVLLMSAQYGMMGGLFATVAASAFLFAAGLPPQSAAQDFYAYAATVAAQPCAWFASALILGGLRTLHLHQHAELGDRLDSATRIAAGIADRLEQTLAENAALEQRIATDLCTLGAVLRGLARLEPGDRQALARGFAGVIASATGAASFALHLRLPGGSPVQVAFADGIEVACGPAPFPVVLHDDGFLAQSGGATLPIRAPIAREGAEPVGVVICTRLHPGQDVAATAARLAELSTVLATLLAIGQPAAAEGALA